MKLPRLIFTIAAVILAAWLLGIVFKFAAWLLNGLVGVAAIILVIGLIGAYLERRKRPTPSVIDIDNTKK